MSTGPGSADRFGGTGGPATPDGNLPGRRPGTDGATPDFGTVRGAGGAPGREPAGSAAGRGPGKDPGKDPGIGTAPGRSRDKARDRNPGQAPGRTQSADTGRPGTSAGRDGRDNSAWGVFRAVVVAVGLLIAAMGIYYLIAGTGGVAGEGGGEVNASLENQFRFFAMMMVGVGAAFVAIAVKFQWANMLWLVCLMVFLGGIGRVISWAFSGTPHFTLIVLMILELAFPPALLVWHRFIAKTVALRLEYSRQGGADDGGAQG